MGSQIDYRSELGRLSASFEASVGGLRGTGSPIACDRGMRPGNIAVLLPYFLVEGRRFEGDLGLARVLALGNAFATSHFLVLDRQMDGDERVVPQRSWLSDRCLVLSVREYARLFPPGSVFWQHLDRYFEQYFTSLRWECDILWTGRGAEAVLDESLPAALRQLGRKLAPVKAAAAGVALLSESTDRLELMERMVEDFHTAYQLSDDLEDLGEDLAKGRWSLVSWIIARASGLGEPPRASDVGGFLELAATSGALLEVAHEISRHYGLAAGAARELGAVSLAAHLDRTRDRSERFHAWFARRIGIVAATKGAAGAHLEGGGGRPQRPGGPPRGDLLADVCDGCAPPSPVHTFAVQGTDFVFDPGSGLLFEADKLAVDVLSWMERGMARVDLDVLRADYGAEALASALADVQVLTVPRELRPSRASAAARLVSSVRPDGPPHPSLVSIACLALDVTDGCNLACDYCYLGRSGVPRDHVMPDEVALQAVDLLLRESLGERRLSIVFFGGEPLLAPDLIRKVVRHARVRGEASGQRVSFHMTTNGTLLTPEVAAELRALDVGFLVSMDGDRSAHDGHRVFPGAVGSYDVIASNLRRLPPDTRLQARATVTPESGPLPEIVSHLSEIGFATVHLAPVSGPAMSVGFAERLEREFADLACVEMGILRAGRAPRVGNFLQGLLALETGPGRSSPCGAGRQYLCVGPDGRLFLCHRFAGDPAYVVGDVLLGVDRDALAALLARAQGESAACAGCWARSLCGGPCFYDLSVGRTDCAGQHAPRCRVRRRILELSMWLYASLSDDAKARLAESACGRARPDVVFPPGAAI